MADFYAARSGTIPPLPWSNFAPPLSPKIGGFQSFKTARRTIAGFEAMLWLRKGFGFAGDWTINDQNDLLAFLFGLQKVNKA